MTAEEKEGGRLKERVDTGDRDGGRKEGERGVTHRNTGSPRSSEGR